MTPVGGSASVGVVFSFNMSKKKYKVLHQLRLPGQQYAPMCIDSSDGATPDHGTLVQSNSTLFGLTTYGGKYGNGTLFSIHTDGSHFKILQSFGKTWHQRRDQSVRLAAAERHHALWHDAHGRQQGQRHRFSDQYRRHQLRIEFTISRTAPTRQKPIDNVILVDNTLYGMTEAGGMCGNGAIFAIVPPP